MTRSTRWCNASSTCRLEWRPSPLGVGLAAVIAVAAAGSVLASGLPFRGVFAVFVLFLGLRSAWRQWRQAPREMAWQAGEGRLVFDDGTTWTRGSLVMRGPLAVLRGRDASGRRQSLAWWPDTLDAMTRRRLRLSLAVSRGSGNPWPTMAA